MYGYIMKCIVNGRIVLADEVVSGKALVYDEKIAEIADADKLDLAKYEVIDAGGNYVAPGLVDMLSLIHISEPTRPY